MRYQVPQFIEVEDKIFGPLTFKQFIYVAGGAAVCFLLFTFMPKFIAILLSLPVAAIAGALAFYKYNERPFIRFVESFFQYAMTNKLYIWKKEDKAPKANEAARAGRPIEQVYVPKLSESKLKELTWNLDVKQSGNPVTSMDKEDIETKKVELS